MAVPAVSAVPSMKFEKPSLPMLWLDTSVVIKLTKIEKGEALQEIEGFVSHPCGQPANHSIHSL
jgi:hypothetical protein